MIKIQFGTDFSNIEVVSPIAEFKFSCPVCHQHIMANAAMAGAQIECPTCFRQIIVPKAPSGETTKLILRGTQAGRTQTRYQSAGKPAPGKTALAKLTAIVTLIVATIALAVSAYAKHNDRLQKATTSRATMNQTVKITANK